MNIWSKNYPKNVETKRTFQYILQGYPEDVNKKDSFGRTPLQYAIDAQQYDAGIVIFSN